MDYQVQLHEVPCSLVPLHTDRPLRSTEVDDAGAMNHGCIAPVHPHPVGGTLIFP
jgi:hypothetical protein